MNKNFYRHFQEMLENKQSGWVVTVVEIVGSAPATLGIKMLVDPNSDEIIGTVGGGSSEKKIIDRILKEKPNSLQKWSFDLEEKGDAEMVCGGSMNVIIEPINNNQKLYLFGAGHVGIALSNLASKIGFDVIVLDSRKDWANKEKHPFASETKVIDYLDIEKDVSAANNFAVIMTHGHEFDKDVLAQLVNLDFKYLGMMGSKAKVKQTFDILRNNGISEKNLEKVYTPIGIKIGSQTPWEIAVSIAGELIKER
ncbi:MAG: XdhC/CoxI family protein [Candidatus Cloacimonadota bacterium]|nr:XdhC/CoxI family protein [Candidatus Cloacimonadota bacterium]